MKSFFAVALLGAAVLATPLKKIHKHHNKLLTNSNGAPKKLQKRYADEGTPKEVEIPEDIQDREPTPVPDQVKTSGDAIDPAQNAEVKEESPEPERQDDSQTVLKTPSEGFRLGLPSVTDITAFHSNPENKRQDDPSTDSEDDEPEQQTAPGPEAAVEAVTVQDKLEFEPSIDYESLYKDSLKPDEAVDQGTRAFLEDINFKLDTIDDSLAIKGAFYADSDNVNYDMQQILFNSFNPEFERLFNGEQASEVSEMVDPQETEAKYENQYLTQASSGLTSTSYYDSATSDHKTATYDSTDLNSYKSSPYDSFSTNYAAPMADWGNPYTNQLSASLY